ncbi:hypothetical protein IVA88_01360 [Bradyrhizobium sp. 149]|nr:hypothetical protein [Bradyrhizobium sp. 149]
MTDTTVTKSKISMLELVYLPMSNQEAVWFKGDPEVEPLLRESDFYIIGGRPEAKFIDFQTEDDEILTFRFAIEGGPSDEVRLDIRSLPGVVGNKSPLWFELGPKGVRIWDGPIKEEGSNVLEWFTTEKLLCDRSHGRPGIEGLDRHAEFSVYDLLYVGIARTGDSFDRLIAKGHHARTEILANEPQRYPGARVSDETYLFLFRVNSLVLQTFELDHDFRDDDFEDKLNRKQVVADAEKAFVSLLKPGYNKVQFAQYPKGADGLYGAGFARYGYLINEDLTFHTAHGRVRGARDPNGAISNSADFIFVNGEDVRLFISGIDFPATSWRTPKDPPSGLTS